MEATISKPASTTQGITEVLSVDPVCSRTQPTAMPYTVSIIHLAFRYSAPAFTEASAAHML